jgi:hypothetical protein
VVSDSVTIAEGLDLGLSLINFGVGFFRSCVTFLLFSFSLLLRGRFPSAFCLVWKYCVAKLVAVNLGFPILLMLSPLVVDFELQSRAVARRARFSPADLCLLSR